MKRYGWFRDWAQYRSGRGFPGGRGRESRTDYTGLSSPPVSSRPQRWGPADISSYLLSGLGNSLKQVCLFPGLLTSIDFVKSNRKCLNLTREAMLRHNWQEAAGYFSSYIQTLEAGTFSKLHSTSSEVNQTVEPCPINFTFYCMLYDPPPPPPPPPLGCTTIHNQALNKYIHSFFHRKKHNAVTMCIASIACPMMLERWNHNFCSISIMSSDRNVGWQNAKPLKE